MSDILKEAIADAKAVRETALQNAKIALEEAFTPQIKSMLSAKLREDDDEFEDEEEFGGEPEVDMGDEEVPEEEPVEGSYYEDDEIPGEEPEVDMGIGDEVPTDEVPGEEEFGDEEEVEENIIELNGQSFRLVPIQEDEVFEAEETKPEAGNLELETIIKELEDELDEEKEEVDESDNPYDRNDQHNQYKTAPKGTALSTKKEKFDETKSKDKDPQTRGIYSPVDETEKKSDDTIDEDDDIEIDESLFEENDEETVDEQSTSSGIGNGENSVKPASASDEEDPGKNEDKPGDAKQFSESYKSLKSELNEYKEAVGFLRDKLHEVNILNAKLLFTNKVFKEFSLDNDQKMKVVENFDRAQTVREIKLVYTTLCENINESLRIKKNSIKESASSKAGSTKPRKKIISEEVQVADRFKKLAGLI